MSINTNEVEALKARYDCRDIAERLFGGGRAIGDRVAYACPFHGGRKGNFTVWVDGWRCWADCNQGGDVITLIMKHKAMDFRAAVEWLTGEKTLRTVADAPLRTESEHKPDVAPDEGWQRRAKAVAKRAADKLYEDDVRSKSALQYLYGRGLTDETIRAARLGFIPGDDQHDLIYGRIISAEWLRNGKPIRVPCGITIPSYEATGDLWGVKVRRLVRSDIKYMSFPGSAKSLYLPRPVDSRPVILCEGEFDALILMQAAGDLVNVAALASASNAAINWRWFSYLACSPRIYARMDDDAAGSKALRKLIEKSERVSPCAVPGGKDINDFYLMDGAEAVRAWVKGVVR